MFMPELRTDSMIPTNSGPWAVFEYSLRQRLWKDYLHLARAFPIMNSSPYSGRENAYREAFLQRHLFPLGLPSYELELSADHL